MIRNDISNNSHVWPTWGPSRTLLIITVQHITAAQWCHEKMQLRNFEVLTNFVDLGVYVWKCVLEAQGQNSYMLINTYAPRSGDFSRNKWLRVIKNIICGNYFSKIINENPQLTFQRLRKTVSKVPIYIWTKVINFARQQCDFLQDNKAQF